MWGSLITSKRHTRTPHKHAHTASRLRMVTPQQYWKQNANIVDTQINNGTKENLIAWLKSTSSMSSTLEGALFKIHYKIFYFILFSLFLYFFLHRFKAVATYTGPGTGLCAVQYHNSAEERTGKYRYSGQNKAGPQTNCPQNLARSCKNVKTKCTNGPLKFWIISIIPDVLETNLVLKKDWGPSIFLAFFGIFGLFWPLSVLNLHSDAEGRCRVAKAVSGHLRLKEIHFRTMQCYTISK